MDDLVTREQECIARLNAAWAQLARRLTTRELKQRVRAVKAARLATRDGAPAEEGACACAEDEDLVRVSWLSSGADRATWGFGLALLRQLAGTRGPVWRLAELLAAETLSSCGPVEVEYELPEGCVRPASGAQASRPRRVLRSSPARKGARKESRKLASALRRARSAEPPKLPAPPDLEACDSAWELLDELVGLARG